jgi:ppGpp synthetase/RelA/SpoT-type nucleotidyltranferase
MTPDEAIARYTTERPRFERAAKSVAAAVAEIAREAGISGRVSGRAKDVDSYRGKLALRKYQDSWRDVTDKCGVRIILERASDVDQLHRVIDNDDRITVLGSEDKRQILDPAKLEYSGVHLQVAAETESGDSEQIECELQLRTSAQDLWSVVSHSLLYKPAVLLPAAEQHAVYRLVALTELFDLEVERIMNVIPSLPGYELSPLLKLLENEFAGIAHSVGNKSLSIQILESLAGLYPDIGRSQDALAAFVDASREDLQELYARFGPGTDMAADFDYALFSQPESLLVLQQLETQPLALEAAWMDADLPRAWLTTLAAHGGMPLENA